MNGAGFRMIILLYRKSSIKPPGGSLFILDTFERGGLMETGAHLRGSGYPV